jgi:hypothetical protein
VEEAKAEVAEILRLCPDYSIEGALQKLSFKDPTMLQRHYDGMRKAGLK